MEGRAVLYYGVGVLRDFAGEHGRRAGPARLYGVLRTDRDAPAAADALVVVDAGLAADHARSVVGADTHAGAAANAALCLDHGLALAVLLHLARARAAAHAEVLERAAEARLLVALEVAQGDDNVSVHDGLTDLGLLDQGQVDGHQGLVGALETVRDDDVAAGLQGGKAV